MMLDAYNLMANATAASAAAGTALIGSQIDMRKTVPRSGSNTRRPLFYLTITTTFTSGGSATVEFILASDSTAAVATDGTASYHWRSGVLAYTVLTANRRWVVPMPLNYVPYERYLGLLCVTAVATTTAGAVRAEIAYDAQDWLAQPEAQN